MFRLDFNIDTGTEDRKYNLTVLNNVTSTKYGFEVFDWNSDQELALTGGKSLHGRIKYLDIQNGIRDVTPERVALLLKGIFDAHDNYIWGNTLFITRSIFLKGHISCPTVTLVAEKYPSPGPELDSAYPETTIQTVDHFANSKFGFRVFNFEDSQVENDTPGKCLLGRFDCLNMLLLHTERVASVFNGMFLACKNQSVDNKSFEPKSISVKGDLSNCPDILILGDKSNKDT